MTMRQAVPVFAAVMLALAACTTPPTPPHAPLQAETAPAGDAMTATRLYFGLSIPGGGTVSEAAWRDFLAREVTPRFPDGLTVNEASGQWRDTRTGRVVRERARVLLVLHKNSAKAKAALADIIARYKARFRQQSVLRIDTPVRVQF